MEREQDRILTEEERKAYEENAKQYSKQKSENRNKMKAMQALPYEVKVRRAEQRIREFIYECDQRGFNTHVSVGGLDSITLLSLIREMGLDVPAIGVSCLEDPSIIRVHKELGIIPIKPLKNKRQILQEEGFPVISKKMAARINALQNPTERNATVRHAIITGECGSRGGYVKNSSMQLPKKWLKLFGGYENEAEGTDYQIPNFKVSNKCCDYMKEIPCDRWAKEHNSKPFVGLMASEGGQRQEALEAHGCNYFGKKTIRSAPFAPFLRNDLLQLALDLNVHVPEIYGEIKRDNEGNLYTTGAQRTGCEMCGFGIHMEKRPHRFDRLYERNPKAWEFWMNHCCTDEDGTEYGWGRVLDYIGVEWRQEGLQIANLLDLTE